MSRRRGADDHPVNLGVRNQAGCLRVVTHTVLFSQGPAGFFLPSAQGSDGHSGHITQAMPHIAFTVSSGSDNSNSEIHIWSVSGKKHMPVWSRRDVWPQAGL